MKSCSVDCRDPKLTVTLKFQHSCFAGKDKNNNKILVDCNDAGARGEVLTPLPENFKPLKLTEKMDKAWFDLVKNFKTNGRPMAGLRRNNNK